MSIITYNTFYILPRYSMCPKHLYHTYPTMKKRFEHTKPLPERGLLKMVMKFEEPDDMEEFIEDFVTDHDSRFTQHNFIIAGFIDYKFEYDDKIDIFIEFASVPIISLESAIRHPLQSLADLVTIKEQTQKARPRVVLSWAPHPRALPQAVSNSFIEWSEFKD